MITVRSLNRLIKVVPKSMSKKEYKTGKIWVDITVDRMGLRLNPSLDIDDVHSFGMIGYMRALATYDPAKGASLRSYCISHIRWNICNFLEADSFLPLRAKSHGERAEIVDIDDENLTCEETQDKDVSNYESTGIIEALLESLGEEKKLVERYYKEGDTLDVLAKQKKLSREAVRQRLKKSMALLRRRFKTAGHTYESLRMEDV